MLSVIFSILFFILGGLCVYTGIVTMVDVARNKTFSTIEDAWFTTLIGIMLIILSVFIYI